ncbi:hypothetical protein QCA50_015824 [Cerrena zonata]|uniref:Uncharacterized protein n=1 Tax=Cerrena zonata TaxID=2478898 RepID=A0AAW0FTY1_9APHY
MSADKKTEKKTDKFANSSFHREGLKQSRLEYVPKPPPKPKAVKARESQFVKELVETGKPNWKLAPKEVKSRRLEGKSTRKVQEGEILENGDVRKFDEAEKWSTEKNSILYKIFGRDFFLDGFTSKTMGNATDNDKDKK